jgi:hypothetical protein
MLLDIRRPPFRRPSTAVESLGLDGSETMNGGTVFVGCGLTGPREWTTVA